MSSFENLVLFGRVTEGVEVALATSLAARLFPKAEDVALIDLEPSEVSAAPDWLALPQKRHPTLAPLAAYRSTDSRGLLERYFPASPEGVRYIPWCTRTEETFSWTLFEALRWLQETHLFSFFFLNMSGISLREQFDFSTLASCCVWIAKNDWHGARALTMFEKWLTAFSDVRHALLLQETPEPVLRPQECSKPPWSAVFTLPVFSLMDRKRIQETGTLDPSASKPLVHFRETFWKWLSCMPAVEKSIEKKASTRVEEKWDPFSQAVLEKVRFLHERLLEQWKTEGALKNLKDPAAERAVLEPQAVRILKETLAKEPGDETTRALLIQETLSYVFGYGPIERYLQNPEITEVMVNGPDRIFIEQGGRLKATPARFRDEEQLRNILERILAPLGRRLDESQPYVDARLPDGSRVNAVLPPLSLNGPLLTVRKFPKRRLTMQDLIEKGSLSPEAAEFLQACVRARRNILVAGGTGSGKTTLLNVLSSAIPDHERIITIEDSAELQLAQAHVVRLEARPANAEGRGRVSIRDLVINALRMRPDRIVVGEVRAAEALDMLQAMNTGHDGSLTTLHANSPRDALARLETLCLMADVELPHKVIREQITRAIHIIVQVTRFADGRRTVTQISEVQGLEGERIVVQDLFFHDQEILKQASFSPLCRKELEAADYRWPALTGKQE